MELRTLLTVGIASADKIQKKIEPAKRKTSIQEYLQVVEVELDVACLDKDETNGTELETAVWERGSWK